MTGNDAIMRKADLLHHPMSAEEVKKIVKCSFKNGIIFERY